MGLLDDMIAAVLRALFWGNGLVGRSMLVLLSERIVTGVVGEEEREELEELSSLCMPSFSSSSSADLLRCCVRSCAGVDFGRGGACNDIARAFSEGRATGLAISPERDWRRRRAEVSTCIL